MKRGQRASSSSESEANQRSGDSKDQSSSCGSLSDEDSSSDSDVEAKSAMKRSQRFSSSFSFGDDQPTTESREEEQLQNGSNGVSVTDVVESELAAECMQMEKKDTFHGPDQPRSGLFRPQDLWLAMTRCLSLRWPPCLSVSRQVNRTLAYQVNLDQSEDTLSSISSGSTNESSSSSSTSDDREMSLVKQKEEEVRSKEVKSRPPPHCRGISRSSPRVPRARQATDSVLASMILEKEMFLRIELVDAGEEKDDLRYRAEWKLSERTKELAEGVWLSRSQNNDELT